ENLCVLQSAEAAFQGTDDSRCVGVKAVEFSILGADNGVAGADLCGVRVGVVEIRKNGFLIGHSNAEAVDRNLADTVQEILESLSVQGQVDSIDVLAAEGRVHDGWRKRVGDGVSGNSVDAGGGVDRIDAVDAAQFLGSNLDGGGFFSGADGSEGEDAAGADSEDTADDALLTHTHADHRLLIGFPSQKLDHGYVVGKGGGRGGHFVVVSGEGAHLLQSLVELFGPPKVMVGEDEAG